MAEKFRYMLIDGNALIHRGFHAIPPLHTKTGEQTNAVYGFTTILLKAIKDLHPTHIACSFDLAGPTFRHEQYDAYKATRVKAAQELYDQIPRVKEVVKALNIPIFEMKGYEADDVLGTLAAHVCKKHPEVGEVMIVTGDMDTLQLVNKCVKIYTLRKGITDTAVYDEKAVRERFNLNPSQMIDYKALRGDPSDNIPGVKGIGEKGASDLISQFTSLENLYEQIHAGKTGNKIKPRILALLTEQEKQARMSYELSKIICNLPLHIDVPLYEFTSKHLSTVVALFQGLEFHSLISKLPKNYVSGARSEGRGATKNAETTVHESQKEVPSSAMQSRAKGGEKYICVENASEAKKLAEKLKTQNEFAVDTETTSVDAVRAKLVGASLSFKDNAGYYIPANILEEAPELKKILENSAKKIGHNIKYDLLTLENAGIRLGGISFDTMIASYLLNAGTRQHNLEALAFNELGYQMQPIDELIGKGKSAITMDQVPVEKVSWYACEDADITWRLKAVFEPRLAKEGLEKIFKDIEMPLIPVLANMERNGIKLDVALLEILSNDAKKQIHALEKSIYKHADGEFNINSPKQMKEVLFEKLKLEPIENRKTKTGLSTAAGELEKMLGQHPIIEKIMQYRELAKLESTYLSALPEMVNPKTGRIHTSYNQTIAATGRLSSTDPNLQNIPVRGEGLGSEIRKAFVAEKSWKLLSIDYSQIELRIVAHIAQDKNMSEIFKKGEDIHTNTAMEVFGVKESEVTGDMRRDAKTINFGILYGLSSFGLSSRIGAVARNDAKAFIEKYFKAYPGVQQYIEAIKAEVREKGFIKNELGRIRKFPEIKASQFFVRAAAERQAVNFPIQSLAADVIKVAMIDVFNEIKDKPDIRMLLQVHDELVFEVKEDRVEHYAKLIKPMMEQAIALSVPVTADAKVGDNWGEMEKIK